MLSSILQSSEVFKPVEPKPVSSTGNPCVRNCCLDDHDICLGCGRTLVEITGWTKLTKAERERVLNDAAKRKKDNAYW